MTTRAFPNIVVNSISVKGAGSGIETTRSDMKHDFFLPEQVTPEFIENAIESANEMLGKFFEFETIEYNLDVRGLTKSGSQARAKTFVRAKNPFEPSITEVKESRAIQDGTLWNWYRIRIQVSK